MGRSECAKRAREINRGNGQRRTGTGKEVIVDKTSSESPHVRVLPLIEASGFLLKIDVTILSEIEGSILVAMTRETVTSEARNHFQNYTHEQCRRRWSLIEEVSKQASKQAHGATASAEWQFPVSLISGTISDHGTHQSYASAWLRARAAHVWDKLARTW